MSLRQANQVFITNAEGLRLSCRVLGSASNPVAILTSGIGCGPVFMHPIAQELARDYQVVYWDYRGHGQSDTCLDPRRYGIEHHAADLQEVVAAFSPHQRPLMVSFSMGVQVNVEWARQHPGRAQAHIFLLGLPRNPLHRTVVFRKPAARIAEQIALRARPLLSLLHTPTRAVLRTPISYALARSLGVIASDCPMDQFLDFVHYATSVRADAYLACAAGLMRHDATETFLGLKEPVLMMAAEHDILINAKECRATAARLPHARFELLRHASHAGSLEYGAYIAKRIRAFLRAQADQLSHAA